MENLFVQLSLAIEGMKEAKGKKLEEYLGLVLTALKTFRMLPHNMLKVLLVRVSGVAKSRDVSVEALEILEMLVDSEFICEILDGSEDHSMILTIVLSALAKNIEQDNAGLKKLSWSCMQKLLPNLPYDVIKAAYPGLLKTSIEEIKKFRCQGLGSSEVGFKSAISCVEVLVKVLRLAQQDKWKDMAMSLAKAAFLTCTDEILMIFKAGHALEAQVQGISMILIGIFELFSEKKDEISYCLIRISACFDLDIEFKFDEEILKMVVLKGLNDLVEIDDGKQTEDNLKIAIKGFEHLGNMQVYFISLYKEKIANVIKFLLNYESPVNIESFLLENWVKSARNNKSCIELIERFVKSFGKFEVFDFFFDSSHNLSKMLKKSPKENDVDNIITLSLFFSPLYPETSLHLLSELIFLSSLSSKQNIFSRFLLVHISYCTYKSNNLSLLEVIENILLSFYPETSAYCIEILEKLNKSSSSIQVLLFENQKNLISSLIIKLKIFGPVLTQHSITQYLKMSQNLETIKNVLEESLKVFDSKHGSYNKTQILAFFQYFLSIFKTLKGVIRSEGRKLENGNMIRLTLMRCKKFLGLKPDLIENRKIIHLGLVIFKESLEMIDQVPFEIDSGDHSAFAFEEDSNVTIPNGLTEIAYEFIPMFVHCFKLMADSNCLGISLALVEILREINNYDKEFFCTDKRFSSKFFTFIRIIFKNRSQSANLVRIKIELLKFMSELSKAALVHVKNEVIEICERFEKENDKNLALLAVSLGVSLKG